MEATRSSETPVHLKSTTGPYIPENITLRKYCHSTSTCITFVLLRSVIFIEIFSLLQNSFLSHFYVVTEMKYVSEYKSISIAVRSLDSSVGITTGYGLDDREVGIQVLVGSRIFFSPLRPDRLCGPPNLLSNGYRRLFPRE
jgi:hypothetical protein